MKTPVHFVHSYLRQPTNPVTVNLIGAGGTGSHLLPALGGIHADLLAMDHPGLQVTVFDDDIVTPFNIGRQGFSAAEIGLPKAVAILSRTNRFYGTGWQAVGVRWSRENRELLQPNLAANLTISCVDTAAARFAIADLLSTAHPAGHGPHAPLYWIDFGNSRHTGQVLLSTLQKIKQPASKRFSGAGELPMVTEEFKELLEQITDDEEPSCSLAAARQKQDLFINRTLAQLGGRLINSLFGQPMLESRGFFLNLAEFICHPLRITLK
jgi:PRTRC genetic system ThiF family protein